MRTRLALMLLATFAGAGCGNIHHPEYHPVTVSNIQQQLSYPVTVQNGGQPSPVYIQPAPMAAQQPMFVPAPPMQPPPPPPGWFGEPQE